MHKKIVFVFILILTLSLILTGCFGGPTNTEDSLETRLVWEGYSNKFFSLQYPASWEQDSDTTTINTDITQYYYVFADRVDLSAEEDIVKEPSFTVQYKENWFSGEDTDETRAEYTNRKRNEVINQAKNEDAFISRNSYMIDGQPAYELVSNRFDKDIITKEIYTYIDNDLLIITFNDCTPDYENSKELGNYIIDTFEFVK